MLQAKICSKYNSKIFFFKLIFLERVFSIQRILGGGGWKILNSTKKWFTLNSYWIYSFGKVQKRLTKFVKLLDKNAV